MDQQSSLEKKKRNNIKWLKYFYLLLRGSFLAIWLEVESHIVVMHSMKKKKENHFCLLGHVS